MSKLNIFLTTEVKDPQEAEKIIKALEVVIAADPFLSVLGKEGAVASYQEEVSFTTVGNILTSGKNNAK